MKDLGEPSKIQTEDKESRRGESGTKKRPNINSEEEEDTNFETKNDLHPHFENLESYDGPGSEFCVRLMCEHEQVMTLFSPRQWKIIGSGQRHCSHPFKPVISLWLSAVLRIYRQFLLHYCIFPLLCCRAGTLTDLVWLSGTGEDKGISRLKI